MAELKFLHHQAYINGTWTEANNGETFEVNNPFNGELIGTVPDMGAAETKMAIAAAAVAQKKWAAKSASGRSKLLRRWFELQMEHAEDLARLLTTEQGKPLSEAMGEIKYGASFVEWFAEEAKRVYGDVIPGQNRATRITVIKQPVGVVGAITPWNFPNAMITRKVAPALAAGCTVVIKPAEDTPLSALALADLAAQAGFPPGVINIITTKNPKAVGEELTTNPIVRKISFTGSTKVGKILLAQSASTVKKVSMELGGNAPFIVFPDADLDEAVKGAISAKYRNGGQTCICANRFFIHEDIYEAFAERFVAASKKQQIGNGLLKETNIGPLINEAALKKVTGLVNQAVKAGAKADLGGNTLHLGKGYFYPPTVLTNLNTSMDIHREEIFGPVAPLFKFSTTEEVIGMANDTDYGLAAYFYGQNYAEIWRVAEALEYGMVGINTGMISTASAPFGGVKQSGIGREGSKYGIEEYLEIKYMCWGNI